MSTSKTNSTENIVSYVTCSTLLCVYLFLSKNLFLLPTDNVKKIKEPRTHVYFWGGMADILACELEYFFKNCDHVTRKITKECDSYLPLFKFVYS